MELNKTEDNKCCFLYFGRGVQDPLSGDQGGVLGPLDPPPPGYAPDLTAGGTGLRSCTLWNGFWATILVLFCHMLKHYVWSIMQCNTQLCLIDVLFCIMIVQLCLLTRPLCILYLQLFNMPIIFCNASFLMAL